MEMTERIAKDMYYLDIAESVTGRSTCLRRKYGAVIVKNDEIISTGYNGSPRGCLNCSEVGCVREILGTAKGDGYNLCASVHAEMNAMLSASRSAMLGGTIYIVGIDVKTGEYADASPCLLCHRQLINAGIKRCIGLRRNEKTNEPEAYEIDISNIRFMNRLQDETRKTINQAAQDGMEMNAAQRFVLARHLKIQQMAQNRMCSTSDDY